MHYKREFVGEMLGTFIMVMFGCGSVAVSILFHAHQGLFQIAMIWGIGVSLAIYAARYLSCAHLNPAVTLAMVIGKRMNVKKMPVYLAGQFLGAFGAGLMVYALFHSSIAAYETLHHIVRGSSESIAVAKMFGEYYRLANGTGEVSMFLAMFAEGFGTFLLVLIVFFLTENCNVGRPNDNIAPLFIGLTVTSIICLIAPLTQAGLNPARDFSPRMVAWIFGWGDAAFPDQTGGFFWVYMFAPLLGGSIAGGLLTHVIEPLMNHKSETCDCRSKGSL
jgi:glycerol uptake facilitator protein